MTALDVITLQEAKDLLRVSWNDDDSFITSIIKTAVSYIEKRTQYYLYERDIEEFVSNGEKLYQFPISIKEPNEDTNLKLERTGKLYSSICFNSAGKKPIKLTIGYDDVLLIPPPLLEACRRLIVFMYDTKEAQLAEIPSDVYMLIQDWIRDRTI